jgi:hypothetical protein
MLWLAIRLSRTKDGPTEKFLLCLTRELKERVKREAHRMFGDRKGSQSLYVEMVLRIYLHMDVDGVDEK